MGKATGFLEYERKNAAVEEPLKRIRHFNEFRTPLPLEEQQNQLLLFSRPYYKKSIQRNHQHLL